MPLHLLGKKSWNVYNTASISRVRKDEAEAQARQEAAEQRMQEEDAARRIAVLRGEAVPEIPAVEDEERQSSGQRREKNLGEDETYASRDRKRKRRRGEDDTERDMRYAMEDRERGERARETLLRGQKNSTSGDTAAAEAPLQDHAGHIQLFAPPDEKQIRAKQGNAEAEAEKAKKRKREEDLVTMKFSNAAGYNNNGMQKPWYAATTTDTSRQSTDTSASRNRIMLAELKGKDVWGNEDPRRKERETKRIVSSDPFAMMQSAQKQLKQSERDKEEWERRRRKELEELRREQQQRKKRADDDEDGLDGFSLDAPAEDEKSEEPRRRHRHHHRSHHRTHQSRPKDEEGRDRRRHRTRSRERDHDREQRRHRSTEREKRSSRSHCHRHRE